MTVMRHLLALLLLLVVTAAAEPMRAVDFRNVRHFDVKDGLSTNYVTSIAQDKRGCLWIGSEAGLNRFDGKDFRQYSLSAGAVTANNVSSLLYDADADCLWVGTRSCLGRLDCLTGKFTRVEIHGLSTWNISALIPAYDGGIWIIPHYHGVAHLSPQREATIYPSSRIKGLIKAFNAAADDGKGHLILAGDEGTVSVLDYNTRHAEMFRPADYPSLAASPVQSVLADSRGNIWLSGNHGITLFILSKKSFHPITRTGEGSLEGDRVFSLFENSDGLIWAGSSLGRYGVFDPADITLGDIGNLRFSNHNVCDYKRFGLSTGNIKRIFQDSFGNIWFCNYGHGLEVLPGMRTLFSKFPQLAAGQSNSDNRSIWSVWASPEGETWLGGTNAVGVYDHGQLRRTYPLTPQKPLTHARVSALGPGGPGELLVGFYDDGMARLDKISGTMTRVVLPKADMGINFFYPQSDGSVLVGTSDGLYRYHDGAMEHLAVYSTDTGGISVTSLDKDSKGRWWTGTYGAGVVIYDSGFKKVGEITASQLKGGAVK